MVKVWPPCIRWISPYTLHLADLTMTTSTARSRPGALFIETLALFVWSLCTLRFCWIRTWMHACIYRIFAYSYTHVLYTSIYTCRCCRYKSFALTRMKDLTDTDSSYASSFTLETFDKILQLICWCAGLPLFSCCFVRDKQRSYLVCYLLILYGIITTRFTFVRSSDVKPSKQSQERKKNDVTSKHIVRNNSAISSKNTTV